MDDHIDKLLNYIRYWQASGERLKTSARTKACLSQIVQEGRFRGGIVPYRYRLEKQGRFNKKNHEVNEILIGPDEAAVVRIIFEKYVYEGFGVQRLSRRLYNNGYLNRKGTKLVLTTSSGRRDKGESKRETRIPLHLPLQDPPSSRL